MKNTSCIARCAGWHEPPHETAHVLAPIAMRDGSLLNLCTVCATDFVRDEDLPAADREQGVLALSAAAVFDNYQIVTEERLPVL